MKNWRIYIPVLINVAIVGFYLYHRDFFKQEDINKGDIVVFVTLIIITSIAMFSISANTKLFKKIFDEIKSLDGIGKNSSLLKSISMNFKELRKEDGINDVNIPSYIEERMSGYSLLLFKKFDVSATKIIRIIQMFVSMTGNPKSIAAAPFVLTMPQVPFFMQFWLALVIILPLQAFCIK